MASKEATADAVRWLENSYPDGLKEMLDAHFAEGMDYARQLDAEDGFGRAECERLREALRNVIKGCVCGGKLETMRLATWGAPQPMDPCDRPQCITARAALHGVAALLSNTPPKGGDR